MSGGAGFGRVVRRELERLASEVRAYPDDDSLWKVVDGTRNSAGTLAWHLVGNLDHYVGGVLGGSGYVRDRDREFNDRVPREQVLARIEACAAAVPEVLEGLSDEAMAAPYPGPLPDFMRGASTADFLVHLLWHLGWHLGQTNYHRRILEAGAAG